MVELRLVGLSEDRQRLILHSVTGQEFTVVVDDRLRAALRGDRARLGQLEIQMDSALRPRDIQARIRAGESPESVAETAQCSVDKILGYAVPVLAERQHVAERAQRSAVRRKGGDGPGRLLGDAVAEQLRASNVDPNTADWDAWRREDGKWTVTVRHDVEPPVGVATFTFDALGRYVVADDDAARWLLGEQPAGQPTGQSAGQSQQRRPLRRLAAVSDDDPQLFNDDEDDITAVANAVRTHEQESTADDYGSAVPMPETAPDTAPEAWSEREETPETEPETEPDIGPGAEPETGPESDGETVTEAAEPSRQEPKRRSRKSRGRASVPSWDEIMFGRAKE